MKLLVTCPELGHLAAVDYQREPGGMVCSVADCSQDRPQGRCGRLCIKLLNHRLAALLAD
jgi:hypothetical protein